MGSKIKRVPKLSEIKSEEIKADPFSEDQGQDTRIDSAMINIFNQAFSPKQNQIKEKRKVPLIEELNHNDGAQLNGI